jgi:hypothetical protein
MRDRCPQRTIIVKLSKFYFFTTVFCKKLVTVSLTRRGEIKIFSTVNLFDNCYLIVLIYLKT